MISYATNDIISYLVARLERDPRVNLHSSPITISVENDRVILEGQVDNIVEKRAALDTVTRVLLKLGRWYIIDWLHVRPTQSRENHSLMQAVTSALSKEPVFRDYSLLGKVDDQIHIERDRGSGSRIIIASVDRGGITLNGQVLSLTHKRLAEVLMWWTDGCEFVENHLQVTPPERDTDNEISDAVRCVLEKDPLVHADQLNVATAGGVVFLQGVVASAAERKLAVRDAWYVPGVADVINHIHSRV